jgi:ABC-type sugar transport system substrate-binding protein
MQNRRSGSIMKKTWSAMLTVVMIFSFIFVAGASNAAETKALKDSKIGLSIHFKTDDYGVICSEGFESACEKAGVGTYTVLDANSDASKQLSDIESFIAQKYDAIVVSPVDDQAVKDVINKATAQGILVAVITTVPGANVVCTVEAGNYEFSAEVAEKLCEKMGYKGKVALMDIPTTLWRTGKRLQAFQDVIAKYSDMEVVAVEKKMLPDEAKATAENLLTAYPDLGGIFGTFSNVTYGAGAAARDMNRKEVVCGGVDADMSILNLMKGGWIYAVAAQFPDTHGIMGAEVVIDALQGKTVPAETHAKYKIYVQGEEEACATEVWRKTL